MSTAIKKKGEKKSILLGNFKPSEIDPNMEDFSNDPYFVKKAESAKRFIEKYGTPESPKKIPGSK